MVRPFFCGWFTLLFILICNSRCCPSDLPDLVPRDAIELTIDGAELSDSESITVRNLGTLKTGQAYYFRFPVYNLSQSSTSIDKIESSCGCLTAVAAGDGQAVSIAPTQSAAVLVIVKPQLTTSSYDKLVKINATNGKRVRLGISGAFVSPVSLSKNTFVLKNGVRKQTIQASFAENWDMSKVSFDDPTNAMSVTQVAPGAIDIEISSESSTACEMNGSFSTVLQAKEKSTGKLVCNIPLTFKCDHLFTCRPSVLDMRKAENGLLINQVNLYGDLDKINFDTIELRNDRGECQGYFIDSKSSRVARLNVSLRESNFVGSGTIKLSFVDKSSRSVVGVFQAQYLGEK